MPHSNVTGLDEFISFLDSSPAQMEQSMHVGLFAGAQLIEATAKANCPTAPANSENAAMYGDYYGALRDSIRVEMSEKGSKVTAVVRAGGKLPNGADVYYAHLIEYSGAAPHIIRARDGGKLAIGGGAYSLIHHPGMQAHPFLRPAVDSNEVAAIGLIDQQIEAAIQNTR
jgi:HK97 gp10 family phage protein